MPQSSVQTCSRAVGQDPYTRPLQCLQRARVVGHHHNLGDGGRGGRGPHCVPGHRQGDVGPIRSIQPTFGGV
jgi:hypothetical protein